MKTKLAIFGLIAVIVVCFGIVSKNLFIEEDDGYRSSRERALIKKFDKDGDGELDKAEKQAIRKAEVERKKEREREWVAKYDKDGDGKLSREEAEAGKAAEKARWAKEQRRDGEVKRKR